MLENENYEVLGLGSIASPPDIRDYRLAATAPLEIPSAFELDMPIAKSQGSVGSCVAHSIALIMEYYNKKQHNKDIRMSVGYIYGNRVSSTHTGSGMVMKSALKDAVGEGNVPYELFPYNREVPEIFNLVKTDKAELGLFDQAQPYRLSSYVKVVTEEEMKAALLNGYPIAFSIEWHKGMTIKDGILTKTKDEKSGGHCMVIYGWDERGWKFQNSWGSDWGDNGCAILPYTHPIKESYCLIDEIVGDIEIKKPYRSKNKLVQLWVSIINKINAWIFAWKNK
jgi:C1A family cysteine protease